MSRGKFIAAADRSNGERARLSRDRVLETALRIADRDGLETLSMRNLAAELGVKAMSLYNHVANKDAIIDGIVDRVVTEIELPPRSTDWKEAMRRRAHSAHRVLLRHRWATGAIVSRVNAGPGMLRYVDATVGCLHDAGFSYEMADHIWNAMDSYIYGFTLQELNFPFRPDEHASAAREFLPQIAPGEYPDFVALARLVAEEKHTGVHDFAFGLNLILDGLERHRGGSPQ
ncbi:MAG: TetR/AcrR family transcriptional regulator C-terminal domain-containing protein [Spirochaeta sp.]|jgi:AcrR family transcriptional regulator|nr:TetR/AcrR family transcriptional regulator C-terminal domain-containing protein [Spirochaeta sp.]